MVMPGFLGIAFCVLSSGPYSAYLPIYLKTAAIIGLGAVLLRGFFLTFLAASGRKPAAYAIILLPDGRPLSRSKTWAWLLAQGLIIAVTFAVLSGPAQIVTLAGLPLLCLYPIMRRGFAFRLWRALTFSWGIFIAYAAYATHRWMPDLSETFYIFDPRMFESEYAFYNAIIPAFIYAYFGSVFWMAGTDTPPNTPSKTARLRYVLVALLMGMAIYSALQSSNLPDNFARIYDRHGYSDLLIFLALTLLIYAPFLFHLWRQGRHFKPIKQTRKLKPFRAGQAAIPILIICLLLGSGLQRGFYTQCNQERTVCRLNTIYPVPPEPSYELLIEDRKEHGLHIDTDDK